MNRPLGSRKIQSVIEFLKQDQKRVECAGISGAERAYLFSCLVSHVQGPVCLVLPTQKSCEVFAQDLGFFAGPHTPEVVIFPPYHISPFTPVAYHHETAAQRVRILYQMAASSTPRIVLIPVEALLHRLIPKQRLCDYAELLMKGEDTDREQLIQKLNAGGYTQVTLVEEHGEYSVRGGVMDIYSPMYADPVRIEMYGDTIDSIRFFSSSTQRSTAEIDEAVILPAREAVLDREDMQRVIGRMRAYAHTAEEFAAGADTLIQRILREGVFPGMEGLLPLIYERTDTVFDYASKTTLWAQADSSEIHKQAIAKEDLVVRDYMTAQKDGRFCLKPDMLYQDWRSTHGWLEENCRLSFCEIFSGSAFGEDPKAFAVLFSVRDNTEISAKLASGKKDEAALLPLAEWIFEKQDAGYVTVLVCGTQSQAARLQSLLEPYGVSAVLKDEGFHGIKASTRKTHICIGRLSGGFVWDEESLAILTEEEIFGAKSGRTEKKRKRGKISTELFDFSDLNLNDLVVHREHGIGVYQGLKRLRVEGVVNDFLLIEYQDQDRLYIPVDRLDMVSKYMGVDGVTPVIDRLGGKSWQRVREKAKKSVEKIADELLTLYAARKVMKGHAYSPTDAYVKEFEAGFPYEETPDQLQAIEDVMEDMEDPSPMDRLICGDVGYGKTEVALRASFKAVYDGKQVAVLVPTTLLAEQHYTTFSQRFARYPVKIDCLSRFRTKKQQKEILERLNQGKTDIIIGTHRLLQKDVRFKDLGLIIIDEEQRFGVKHKEKLKKMRNTVDVLSMTATPIPRTLHMSLLGIRDISVIQTPPELRRSIISYISEFSPAVIVEAVRKELARKGQIFFIHNNIHNIWNMAGYLQQLVPEIRLGVAHGRLGEDELEQVMYRFLNREIDMLVSTAIVESGLDIPNANTMIINRADRFGLAQIYQLRGRVGRSDEQAYAYLFVPKESALSRDAQKRLKVLMAHNDLGAGFQIAMSDLKIRGGGAALGVEQSGHIAAVGYDLFLGLLEEAVARLKGEPVVENLEPEINVPLSVFIPESYIPDIDQRLLAYRRLSRMKQLKEIADFKRELVDRYGRLPQEAIHLLLKIMLKVLCINAGVKKLDLTDGFVFLSFSPLHQKNPLGVTALAQSHPDRFVLTSEGGLRIKLNHRKIEGAMAEAKNLLIDIAGSVNNQKT